MADEDFYVGQPLSDYLAHAGSNRFSPNHVMEAPAVWREIGDPNGLRVLDLGCGDGGFGILLLEAGAAGYLGIDRSPEMIGLAERKLAGLPGRVELGDLSMVVIGPAEFELVTARLSLHYLADLEPVLHTVAQSLVPGGRFVMTVVHPVLTSRSPDIDEPRMSWLVDDYFAPGPRTRPWFGSNVVWQHRTIEQYVDAVLSSGLQLQAVRECAPVWDRFDGDRAEFERRSRVPSFLLITAQKPGA